MKIKIWRAITDGGDGEHHSHDYKSKQEMIDDLGLTDVSDGEWGSAFDEYDYNVDFKVVIFDTEGYEVVE
jgi:hypothetical protein